MKNSEFITQLNQWRYEARAKSAERISACPNSGKGPRAAAKWRREYPYISEDEYVALKLAESDWVVTKSV